MRRTIVGIVVLAVIGVQPAAAAGRVPLGQEFAGVDRTATLSSDGTIVIGGALDCTSGFPVRITVTLTQRHSGATGQGAWSGTCTGEGPSRAHRSQRWTTTVTPTSSAGFRPGTGASGLGFHGVVTFGDVTDDWQQEPINLASAE